MKRLIINLTILLMVISVLTVRARSTNALGPQFSKENCAEAQVYISKTLRKNDLRARVDRAQFYESIYHDLEILASRMSKNDQSGAKELQALATNLESQVKHFKKDYEDYDASREKISDLGACFNNYNKFQSLLRIAQGKRAQLHVDISNLNNLITSDVTDQLEEIYDGLNKDSTLDMN